MTEFRIYTESNKLVWTRKRILFGIFIITFGIITAKIYLPKNFEFINDNVAQIIGYIGVAALFLSLVNSFFPEQLKGKFEGNLVLDFSKVVIKNNNYNLTDIKSIIITTGTSKGQFLPQGYAAFSDNISNGVNNELQLILNSGEIVKCNFEIDYERKMFQATNELKNYVDKGKLSNENFIEIYN